MARQQTPAKAVPDFRQSARLALRIAALILGVSALWSSLAGAAEAPEITLYVNPKTHIIYTEPVRGTVPFGRFGQLKSAAELQREIEAKTHAQLEAQTQQIRQELETRDVRQQQWNAQMAKEVSEMQPAWRDFGDRWFKKISIGTLVYGDWSMYSHTGWGPQFLENIYTPGPGNDAWNSFDITRAYLDTRFTPNQDFDLRLTPELYRQVGAPQPDKIGSTSAVNSNLDGLEEVRVKYAYLDYRTFFKSVLHFEPAATDVITFGIQQNPFITWEENLWGYRYVTLSPWNYVGLSSAATGIRIGGPIKFNEKQYIDYEAGVFNDGNSKQYDASNVKQFMGRVSVYPFGATSQFQGLGLTAFYDYGYPNTYAPDRTLTSAGLPLAANASANGHITRAAFLASYEGDTWQIAGQYDWGHNAFNANSYFNGAAPVDAFSSSFVPSGITCKPVTVTKLPATITPSCSFSLPSSTYASWAKMVGIFQNASNTEQEGFDFFGHWDIPETPFTLFGLFTQFMPNMKVNKNPLDFQRWVGGVEWRINSNLRVAVDTQNLLYYHSQFAVPASELAQFTTFGKKNPAFSVANAVPTDVHAFYINFEFRY